MPRQTWAFKRWLIHRTNIESSAGSALATGEIAETWSIESGTVSCRLTSSRELRASNREGPMVKSQLMMYFPPGTTIDTYNRVGPIWRISDGGTIDASYFTIEEVLPRRGMEEQFISVAVQKII